jgi:hypothetical protein
MTKRPMTKRPMTKRPMTKRAATLRHPTPPAPPAGDRPAPQPVTPLPLRAASRRYRVEHVPAFLTDDWYAQHLVQLRGVSARLLRRAAAIVLVQLAEPCRVADADAADFLGIPDDPARSAFGEVASWVRHTHHGSLFLDAVHALADQLDSVAAAPGGLVDYHRRRTALADWQLPEVDWAQITEQLRRRDRYLRPFDRSDYGDRKRNSACALIWIRLTHGEHRFAPHRQSPTACQPGSTDDWGLAIDRT